VYDQLTPKRAPERVTSIQDELHRLAAVQLNGAMASSRRLYQEFVRRIFLDLTGRIPCRGKSDRVSQRHDSRQAVG
jgi:hypothetical protein